MYIGYSNSKLEQICTNPIKAYKHFSDEKLVRILIKRLNQFLYTVTEIEITFIGDYHNG